MEKSKEHIQKLDADTSVHLLVTAPRTDENDEAEVELLQDDELSALYEKVAEEARDEGEDSLANLQKYFNEIHRYPLLTQDQEINLAKRIERGERARAKLEITTKKNAKLLPEERARLDFFIHSGKVAQEILTRSNTRLVVSIAKKYQWNGVAFLDLIQEGNLGLMKAVMKYDFRKGYKFSTYATWWIRQAILKALSIQSRTIRLPLHVSEAQRRLFRIQAALTQELLREPTIEELVEASQLKKEVVIKLLSVSTPASLDKPIGDDLDADEFGDFVMDPSAFVERIAEINSIPEQIVKMLSILPPRMQTILIRRFVLDGDRQLLFKELGKYFGISLERVRQLEEEALKKLRKTPEAQALYDFFNNGHPHR